MTKRPGNRGNGRAGSGPAGPAGRGPGRSSKPCGLLAVALPVIVLYLAARALYRRIT